MLRPEQIRMARAALKWGVRELAKKSKLSPNAVSKIENGESDARASTLTALQDAFEKAGIVFLPENGGGAGIRFKKRATK